MGVGQVVEHDCVRDPERRRFLLPQSLLQRLAVFPGQGADAVERLARQRPAVCFEAKQFGQGAVALQPAAGLPLAGGMDHPRRDKRGGNARVRQAEPAGEKNAREAEILQRLEADPFRPDRHRVLVLHAVQIRLGDRRVGLAGQPHAFRPQLPSQALRVLLHRLRFSKKRWSPGQDLFGPLGNAQPQLAGRVPASAQVQQRPLADPAVHPVVAYQPMGPARPSRLVGMGLGGLEEHASLLPPRLGGGGGAALTEEWGEVARGEKEYWPYNENPGCLTKIQLFLQSPRVRQKSEIRAVPL